MASRVGEVVTVLVGVILKVVVVVVVVQVGRLVGRSMVGRLVVIPARMVHGFTVWW